MSPPLTSPWTEQQRQDFGSAPVCFAHHLADTGLFEDEALVRLLDGYPEHMIDINLFDSDDASSLNLRTGARGGLDGAGMLEAVKTGRVWIQLRRANEYSPALGSSVRRCFREISAQAQGFRPIDLYGQLLLSAPGARVPYHADAPGVVLFHVRGRKRVYVYPRHEAYLPQDGIERIVMRTQTEDLAYRREMDAGAAVFDLEPGQALAWPLHAPHRVENLEGFNVSFSADYQTWESRFTNGAHLLNGVLRRRGWRPARMEKTPLAARAVLWAASGVVKRLGLAPERLQQFEKTFELGTVTS